MTNHSPRVSIGIPVYNGEPFLSKALDSILAQTFDNFELIISDNASTDGTRDICQDYAARDKRINYYKNKTNLGAAFNYNRVFELSSGEYFKWAAADDLCAPDLLEKCAAVLDSDPEVILCYPKTDIIDESGIIIKEHNRSLNLRSDNVIARFRQAIMTIGECNAVFGLIRSEILKKTSLIGRYPGSDRVLLTELTLYGQFSELPDRLFFRREHAQASSCNRSIESTQEFFDPKTKGKICLPKWKHQVQDISNIVRAPLRQTEKMRLFLCVLRFGVGNGSSLVKELLAALRPL